MEIGTEILCSKDTVDGHRIKLIFDGNSILEHLYRSSRLNWVAGGQNTEFMIYVQAYFAALKEAHVDSHVLFFNSPRRRASPRTHELFSHVISKHEIDENSDTFLPLFAHDLAIEALKSIQVHTVTLAHHDRGSGGAQLALMEALLFEAPLSHPKSNEGTSPPPSTAIDTAAIVSSDLELLNFTECRLVLPTTIRMSSDPSIVRMRAIAHTDCATALFHLPSHQLLLLHWCLVGIDMESKATDALHWYPPFLSALHSALLLLVAESNAPSASSSVQAHPLLTPLHGAVSQFVKNSVQSFQSENENSIFEIESEYGKERFLDYVFEKCVQISGCSTVRKDDLWALYRSAESHFNSPLQPHSHSNLEKSQKSHTSNKNISRIFKNSLKCQYSPVLSRIAFSMHELKESSVENNIEMWYSPIFYFGGVGPWAVLAGVRARLYGCLLDHLGCSREGLTITEHDPCSAPTGAPIAVTPQPPSAWMHGTGEFSDLKSDSPDCQPGRSAAFLLKSELCPSPSTTKSNGGVAFQKQRGFMQEQMSRHMFLQTLGSYIIEMQHLESCMEVMCACAFRILTRSHLIGRESGPVFSSQQEFEFCLAALTKNLDTASAHEGYESQYMADTPQGVLAKFESPTGAGHFAGAVERYPSPRCLFLANCIQCALHHTLMTNDLFNRGFTFGNAHPGRLFDGVYFSQRFAEREGEGLGLAGDWLHNSLEMCDGGDGRRAKAFERIRFAVLSGRDTALLFAPQPTS